MTESLRTLLTHRGNDHTQVRARFEERSGLGWHERTPAHLASLRALSIVIPAHNVGHCLEPVLNSVVAQTTGQAFEVIVVDDASTDETAAIAHEHSVVTCLVRLQQRMGAAAARNIGTAFASAETILYLDADMVIPNHVVADICARTDDGLVLLGFRHNVPFGSRGVLDGPGRAADLYADHRARWRPPAGRLLPYSGIVLDRPLDGRPLDHTRDLLDLGFGKTYFDWDLPRMVVTALLAVPRAAVLSVGGFDEEFGRLGWGMEDTHLGAKLIASGLLVMPLRQAVGFHLDPPDADQQWQSKLSTWPNTLAHYRRLLEQPPGPDQTAQFFAQFNRLRPHCEVIR